MMMLKLYQISLERVSILICLAVTMLFKPSNSGSVYSFIFLKKIWPRQVFFKQEKPHASIFYESEKRVAHHSFHLCTQTRKHFTASQKYLKLRNQMWKQYIYHTFANKTQNV